MNTNEHGFLLFKCNYDEDSLPYRLFREWSKWYGTSDAGYSLSYFDEKSQSILQQLIALGVLEIKGTRWYVTVFGETNCEFRFVEHTHTLYIGIPLENDYLPF